MKEPTSVRIVVKSWANQINKCWARFVVSEITAELALFTFDKRVDNRSQIIYL